MSRASPRLSTAPHPHPHPRGRQNCAYAFTLAPRVLEAIRSGALDTIEHLLTGAAPLPPTCGEGPYGEAVHDVAPPHSDAVVAYLLELLRALACHYELLSRCSLLLAEARLEAGAAAPAAALVAALVGAHLRGLGGALRGRAAWMAAAIAAHPPQQHSAPQPRLRLLFAFELPPGSV